MRIDLEAWLHAVCADPLTTQSAGKLACVLVRGFKNSSSGSYQVSFERLADLSGVHSLRTLRHSLDRLRSRGWLIVERDQRTPQMGMIYWPTVPAEVEAEAKRTHGPRWSR